MMFKKLINPLCLFIMAFYLNCSNNDELAGGVEVGNAISGDLRDLLLRLNRPPFLVI